MEVKHSGYLMYKDTKLLYFDLDGFVISVINNDLLPFELRSCFKCDGTLKGILKDIESLKGYLGSRVLSLSRDNAKLICAMFSIPQTELIDNKVDVCLSCHGVSVDDSYWISFDGSNRNTWSHYNARVNHLTEIIDIALFGEYPTITSDRNNPELTSHGLFRKCWIRENNSLYLLKSDKTDTFINTRMEVLASQVLSCFNIDSIEYTGQFMELNNKKLYVSKCKNFVTEDYDFVEAQEIYDYCKRQNINYEEYLMSIDNTFANMIVLDYIILNTDRHLQNYGYLMNTQGKLVRMSPIFDLNLALVADYFGKNKEAENSLSQTLNNKETIKGLMKRYLPKSSLEFNRNKFNQLYKEQVKYRNILDNALNRINTIGL
jgi:hypothetical protein